MSLLFRNFVICQVDKKRRGINNLWPLSCIYYYRQGNYDICMTCVYRSLDVHWKQLFCDCCLNENYGLNIRKEEKCVEEHFPKRHHC